MPTERLDLRSARFDRFANSVLIDGRRVVVEVTKEALEALYKRDLEPDEALRLAVEETKRLTRLATRLPADDGKIVVTTGILMNDGLFGEDEGSA